MNAALFPMSRRCSYCGMPKPVGRLACNGHSDLPRLDPWYAAEVNVNTTGTAAVSAESRAAVPLGGK